MKLAKIEVYKIVLLSIATLGVYNYVWFAKRRNEIVAQYKIAIPHWWWLVTPVIVSVVAAAALVATLITAAPLQYIILSGAVLLLALLSFLPISIWWMVMLGLAAGRITNGRVPAGWTIAYWLLLGSMGTNIMLQFYFNKLTDKPAPAAKPSTRFIVVSCILFAAVIGLSTADSIYSTTMDREFQDAIQQLQDLNTDDVKSY